MFDGTAPSDAPTAAMILTVEWLHAVASHLRVHGFEDGDLDNATRIEQITLLETLKATASAVQAHRTATFAAVREAELSSPSSGSDAPPTMSERPRALRTADQQARARRDIGAQIALARKVSPRRGTQLVGMAKVLTGEMPALMSALRRGRVDEYQAMLVVAETATLSRAHRQAVDAELADRFGTMTAARARSETARIGYRLDPEQAVTRARKGHGDRCVTLRPAPDSMTYLTALLPAASGVSAYAALTRHAAAAKASGDARGTGALMADALLARLIAADPLPAVALGHTDHPATDEADGLDSARHLDEGLPTLPTGVAIEIQLVMTDRTLLDGDTEPAILTGYGPIPAPLARHLVRGADSRTRTWVRRLFADADTGRLTDADTRRRRFSHATRQFLVARDQVCRTPWCGAPIRHADHIRPHARGGPTDLENGAGLCAACNQTKEAPGWSSETDCDGGLVITTPTGHRHRSRPPEAPSSAPWADEPTEAELRRRSLRRLEALIERRSRAA